MKNRSTMRRVLSLVSVGALATLFTASLPGAHHESTAEDPIFEIRSYHFEPSRLAEYRAWAERDTGIAEVFGTAEWGEIFSQLPGGLSGYLRMESQFVEEL